MYIRYCARRVNTYISKGRRWSKPCIFASILFHYTTSTCETERVETVDTYLKRCYAFAIIIVRKLDKPYLDGCAQIPFSEEYFVSLLSSSFFASLFFFLSIVVIKIYIHLRGDRSWEPYQRDADFFLWSLYYIRRTKLQTILHNAVTARV